MDVNRAATAHLGQWAALQRLPLRRSSFKGRNVPLTPHLRAGLARGCCEHPPWAPEGEEGLWLSWGITPEGGDAGGTQGTWVVAVTCGPAEPPLVLPCPLPLPPPLPSPC